MWLHNIKLHVYLTLMMLKFITFKFIYVIFLSFNTQSGEDKLSYRLRAVFNFSAPLAVLLDKRHPKISIQCLNTHFN